MCLKPSIARVCQTRSYRVLEQWTHTRVGVLTEVCPTNPYVEAGYTELINKKPP